jgi:hypothetical protein
VKQLKGGATKDIRIRIRGFIVAALLITSVALGIFAHPLWLVIIPVTLLLAWPPKYGPEFVLEGWRPEDDAEGIEEYKGAKDYAYGRARGEQRKAS